MSNLGLERHLENAGLSLVRTQVGDRYVVDHMRQHGFNVGGEQSGHIVLSDYSTTGDGLIAALQALAVLAADERPVSAAGRLFEPLPQILRNVPVRPTAPSPWTTIGSGGQLPRAKPAWARPVGWSSASRARNPLSASWRRARTRA